MVTFWFKIIMFLSATWIQISLIPTLSMFNKNWWFLNFQKEFLNFSFCICKLAVAFYMINEIQPEIKFQNIVQCPFKYQSQSTLGNHKTPDETCYLWNYHWWADIACDKITDLQCWSLVSWQNNHSNNQTANKEIEDLIVTMVTLETVLLIRSFGAIELCKYKSHFVRESLTNNLTNN